MVFKFSDGKSFEHMCATTTNWNILADDTTAILPLEFALVTLPLSCLCDSIKQYQKF